MKQNESIASELELIVSCVYGNSLRYVVTGFIVCLNEMKMYRGIKNIVIMYMFLFVFLGLFIHLLIQK